MDSMRVIAVTALVLFVAALPANCEECQPGRAGQDDVRAAVALPR